ncbi:MAG: dTDP-4-dehydrorhamnose 3,5-epimerase [Bacteroidia bacterium]|nr:dTDP-4-dehydrorhamnose 3,5-epimerase [Bacteroidia bacterium]NNF31510.1 dTDP-4-dehydrorhamnose 3,5-epimerase [Flavobacteriaceae bacterium]MBT8275585.1 dTDP-4-dehydrorhamnose 3,5-epimerase [Bacteroidia bacterium]NNJ82775.1 dTDP-4-dehydrorhamnose 3,5-epimerase [Flavobacteriaceae bacterium]NNK54089.1 dTDP-4-dehydrorhamnose 3,5-epimerase [Flavobacteriaceae bacterium]
MEKILTPLKDCFALKPRIFSDERGTFYETYNENTFKASTGIDLNFVQDNQSTSSYGVLRGLHFQKGKMAQAKLVRVIAGKVLDIVVDLRPESGTFGKSYAIELSDKNHLQLFVPRGFAHGFVTLSDRSVFAYKCDNFYNKSSEGGIIYNDATLNLDWHLPEEDLIISEKDLQLPGFEQAIS